jgi:carbon-monoxide dehydrogenase iron sulfur subunit
LKPTILYDARLCVRCKRCQLGCAVRNSKSGNLVEAMFETPAPLSNMQMKILGDGNVAGASSCRHCEGDTAYCIAACPVDALYRDAETDLVLQDHDKCVHCTNCVVVCPYGAPRVRVQKKAKGFFKCDLCVERLSAGQEPACVEHCHSGALTFKKLEKGAPVEPAAESLEALGKELAADKVQALLQGKPSEVQS